MEVSTRLHLVSPRDKEQIRTEEDEQAGDEHEGAGWLARDGKCIQTETIARGMREMVMNSEVMEVDEIYLLWKTAFTFFHWDG